MKNSNITPIFYDIYSYYHLMTGYSFYMIMKHFYNMSFKKILIIWIIIHSIYECKDIFNTYILKIKPYSENIFISNNSFYNSIGDTLFTILGVIIAFLLYKLPYKRFTVNISIILIMFIFMKKILV